MGAEDGSCVGVKEGCEVGVEDGSDVVGFEDGEGDGGGDGSPVGVEDGRMVGAGIGKTDGRGDIVGTGDGAGPWSANQRPLVSATSVPISVGSCVRIFPWSWRFWVMLVSSPTSVGRFPVRALSLRSKSWRNLVKHPS